MITRGRESRAMRAGDESTAAGGSRSSGPAPSVSVVIATYSSERWGDLRDCVASVRAQTMAGVETIVVVDHNDALLERVRAELPDVLSVVNGGAAGASGARNSGAAVASGQVLAFIDDDAVAAPTWLERLCLSLEDPVVLGVGGRVSPIWPGRRPRWFPEEFDWVVGASYRGLPIATSPIRNIWSNNMAIKRAVFDAVGGFHAAYGKKGQRSRPEDTELCLAVQQAFPGGHWLYDPPAEVSHRVPPKRATVSYFVGRCWNEGRGKADMAGLYGVGRGLSSETSYLLRVLPSGLIRNLVETARERDLGGLGRVVAIGGGAAVTAAGLVAGWLLRLLSRGGGRDLLRSVPRSRGGG
jgi:glycosyltransferase involved in cell wall biosynthesis